VHLSVEAIQKETYLCQWHKRLFLCSNITDSNRKNGICGVMTFPHGQHEANMKPVVPEKPVSVQLILHCNRLD